MSQSDNPAGTKWFVSSSPHLRENETIARIMWSVVAALVPAGAWSVYLFGWPALYVIALSVGTAVVTEFLLQRWRGRPTTISDGSAVVTGLLLAYVLPSHSVVVRGGAAHLTLLKWQVPVIGAVVAIAIAKHCFGGLGHNIWNPALVGRAFVQIAFPQYVSLSAWPWPAGGPDAVTAATSLCKSAPGWYSVKDLFFGWCPGSLGEVSAFLLLIGAAYLIARRYVDWRLPLGYILVLLAFTTLFAWSPAGGTEGVAAWVNDFAEKFRSFRAGEIGGGDFFGAWLLFAGRQIFSGGVIIGAFFMATDMVTSPLTPRGQLIFGAGCGLLTAVIRFYSGYPEGVCYAILLMNTVRPYIDRYVRPRVLGETRGG